MKFYTVILIPALLLVGCGSRPAPPVAQQQLTSTQPPGQPGSAPPVVAAQQPFPPAAQGAPASPAAAPQQPQPDQPQPQQQGQPEISIPSGTSIQVRLNET